MSSTDKKSQKFFSVERDQRIETNVQRGPLIEVIGETAVEEEEEEEEERLEKENGKEKEKEMNEWKQRFENDLSLSSSSSSSSLSSPPSLLFDIHSTKSKSSCTKEIINKNLRTWNTDDNRIASTKDEPSLMERMMAEGMKKRKEEKTKKIINERILGTNKSTFASGFQKGFLTKSASNKKKSKGRGRKKEMINTSSSSSSSSSSTPPMLLLEGNINDQKVSHKNNNDTIPTIKANNEKRNKFELEEVQNAMNNESILYKIQKNFGLSPEQINKIVTENPKLMAGMSNPKYISALQSMQTHPRETMKEMEKHPDIMDFLKEYMNVMGNHFIMLSEKKKKNLGPFVEETIDRLEKEQLTKGHDLNISRSSKNEISNKDDEQVEKILQDKELVDMLMDPNFQRIMKECSIPGKMREYMNHPTYGQKLRKMMNAGLLRMT